MLNAERGKQSAQLPANTDVLIHAPFEFHLTGSHYFGCATEESDWDFITAWSEEVVSYLLDNGFKKMGGADGKEYGPSVQAGVTHAVYQKDKVQVQVVYDCKAVCAARTMLAAAFSEEHKSVRGAPRTAMRLAAIKAAQDIAYGARPDDTPLF